MVCQPCFFIMKIASFLWKHLLWFLVYSKTFSISPLLISYFNITSFSPVASAAKAILLCAGFTCFFQIDLEAFREDFLEPDYFEFFSITLSPLFEQALCEKKEGASRPHSLEALAYLITNTERHATIFVVCQPRSVIRKVLVL